MPRLIFSDEERDLYIEHARRHGYKVTKKAFKKWTKHAENFVSYMEFFEDYMDYIGTKIQL